MLRSNATDTLLHTIQQLQLHKAIAITTSNITITRIKITYNNCNYIKQYNNYIVPVHIKVFSYQILMLTAAIQIDFLVDVIFFQQLLPDIQKTDVLIAVIRLLQKKRSQLCFLSWCSEHFYTATFKRCEDKGPQAAFYLTLVLSRLWNTKY